MTTNIQLTEMAEKLRLPYFRGIFMADEMKNIKPSDKESGICNFQNVAQNGSHWVAWFIDKSNKYYFDSYGSDILPELKDYLGSRIKCHNFQIQEFNSDICGELCVLFIWLMSKNIQYEQVILSLL